MKARAQIYDTLTLGALIAELERCSGDAIVCFDWGGFNPGKLDSYRGYYEDLALGAQDERSVTVTALLALLKGAVGKTFEGWKGGSYTMDRDTMMWVANSGSVSGTAIAKVVDKETIVVLQTKLVDD